MDLKLFLSTFGLIFITELPDKTALAVLFMAARQNPRGVFTGAAAAFVVQTIFAIIFGSFLSLLPPRLVHLLAGVLFWVFAVTMILKKEKAEEIDVDKTSSQQFWKAASTSFTVIFLAEWGDLTQLASATLQAKYKAPATIFLASVLALWSVTALGAALGHSVRKSLRPERIRWVGAIAFAVIGTLLLFHH